VAVAFFTTDIAKYCSVYIDSDSYWSARTLHSSIFYHIYK